MIHIVFLSGGSGTRLWPLSNSARSKQFLKVLRNSAGKPESMVQRTFRKISEADLAADITVATCEAQAQSLAMQLGSCKVVLEPERRDTAPAIMLACAHLASEQGANYDDTVVVMPIDTYAEDAYYMRLRELDAAVQADLADLALLGVEPAYPTEKYGYIMPAANASSGSACAVARFVEKPPVEEAALLISEGALWNCGVFAFKLGYLTKILSRYATDTAFAVVRANYEQLPRISFDYEVVEKSDSVVVVPYAGFWKDLGTWSTLTEEMAEDVSGRVTGIETCENTHVVNELNLPVVVAGLQDVAVVATCDGILVADKGASSDMKPLVEAAQETRAMYERRRWGEYRVLDAGVYPDESRSLTKELVIEAGRQLSYQCHEHRSEVWIVVSGKGEVVLDGIVNAVSAGSTVSIQKGRKHALRAFEDVHIIEVQLGDLLEEEDIERFGNFWENKL